MSLIPLESNPEVINKFLLNLGVPEIWQVTELYSLDEDALAIVPRPVVALILLFPTTDSWEEHCLNENTNIKEKGQNTSPNIYYMRQYLHNACGTIAIIHSVANNLDQIELGEGCLKQFLNSSSNLSSEEKGKLLQNDQGIIAAHEAIASEGQTQPPRPNEELDHHFIAFVCRDGHLYELDGIRPFPVIHGPSSPDVFLEDAAKVVREFMARDPNNLGFTAMALGPVFD